MNLSELENYLANEKTPPVHLWQPEHCGEIDIRIDRDGRWYHHGTEIRRDALVRLFASVLLKEGQDYYLITPVEKVRIQVDAEPFCLVDAQQIEGAWVFTERLGQQVILDQQHPLFYHENKKGEPYPTLLFRQNLSALIHRNLFYHLLEQAELGIDENGTNRWLLTSKGERFLLASA